MYLELKSNNHLFSEAIKINKQKVLCTSIIITILNKVL